MLLWLKLYHFLIGRNSEIAIQRNYPDWIRAYLEYTRVLEAPDTCHFWSAVAAIAGALRGKCWFDMGFFKWKPNFFIILVGPPGIINKSTTIEQGYALLREVPGIHFGPDSVTWQGLTDAFAEASEEYTLADNLGVLSSSSITIAASELGTFLDPRNREMIDVLVDLWDGRPVPWKRRTKGEGQSEIANPWFNFVGCTTPGWMHENFPEYAIQGGFTSRTVFVYGEHKRFFNAYPHRSIVPKERMEMKSKLVEDLKLIAKISGPFDLTEDAYAWGEKWYGEHWQRPPNETDSLAGYKARKQTHIHKLAMVLSADKSDDRVIQLEDIKTANTFISTLESTMPSVFSAVTENRDTKFAAMVVKQVKHHPKITKTEVWRKLFNVMSINEFNLALQAAVIAGYVKETNNGTDLVLSYVGPREKAPQSQESPDETLSHSADHAPVEVPDDDAASSSPLVSSELSEGQEVRSD